MTLATLMPYLLVGAGYLIRHFDLLGGSLRFLAGPNPLTPPGPQKPAANAPAPSLNGHPVLSDAVNAAIKQAVNDAASGHLQSIRAEIQAAAKAALDAAVADLKAKG